MVSKLTKNLEYILGAALAMFLIFLRFYKLGFSHFFYNELSLLEVSNFISISKVVPEFWVRFPFALAGVLFLAVLYLLVRYISTWQTAFITVAAVGLNGLFIAHGRLASIHNVLLLVIVAGYLFLAKSQFIKQEKFRVLSYLFWSAISVCFVLAFGIYFDGISIDFRLFNGLYSGLIEGLRSDFYYYTGYNPYILSSIFVFLAAGYPLLPKLSDSYLVNLWFVFSFLLFGVFLEVPPYFSIYYLIPLFIMCAQVLVELIRSSKKWGIYDIVIAITVLHFAVYLTYSFITFIPLRNKQYPWKQEKFYSLVNTTYFYGFPYNRSWELLSDSVKALDIVEYWSNESAYLSEFYLSDFSVKSVGPEYIIEVKNNQMFRDIPLEVFDGYLYKTIAELEYQGRHVAKIHKKTSVLRIRPQPYIVL